MSKIYESNLLKKVTAGFAAFVLAVSSAPVLTAAVYAADAFETSISGFPDSYKPYLRTLHTAYPAWTFKPLDTGLDFSAAVSNEAANNLSLVENAYNEYLKSNAPGDYDISSGTYIAKDGSSWVSASKNAVAYFMDPRNFLNEDGISMFEQLSYDGTMHTQAGVEAVLSGSFMHNKQISYLTASGQLKTLTGTGGLYSAKFIEAAKSSGVNPYYLAAKSLQEVGKTENAAHAGMGASGSVNGTFPGYPGIYNFYNIGASDGSNPVANGLKWAGKGKTYRRPWDTPEKSIIGGAEYIGEKYIKNGQNTSYFQRFNVCGSSSYSLYTHQYMTNIYGCAAEAAASAAAYKDLGISAHAKTFIIPVYNNMPSETTTVKAGGQKKTGTVNTNVNLRKAPDTSSGLVTMLSAGDPVTVDGCVMTDISYSVKWLNNPYWYKVTAVHEGASYDGYVSANYIDVTPELNIIKGVPQKLSVSVSASETVYYATDDPAVATVDASGNINGVSAGQTTIRVYTQAGGFNVCGVQVMDKGAVISEKNITLNLGQKKKLIATVYPLNEVNRTVSWSSSNAAVASVGNDGTVSAKSVGTAVIYAKAAAGGATGQCVVRVIRPVTGVKLSKKSLKVSVGESYRLKATVLPVNATIKSVKWKSSDKKIATAKKGLVKGVSAGQVTVTVTTANGGKKASCAVTVKPATTQIVKAKSTGYNKVRITWNPVAGSSGYKIFRKSGKGKYKLRVKVDAGAVSYTDTGLVTSREYFYKVAAFKISGKKTYVAVRSAAASVRPVPAKPKVFSARNKGKRKAHLSWKAVKGSSGYCVYRRDGATGKFRRIKNIKSKKTLSCDDIKLKKGVTYSYKVRAYRKTGGKKVYGKFAGPVLIVR